MSGEIASINPNGVSNLVSRPKKFPNFADIAEEKAWADLGRLIESFQQPGAPKPLIREEA